MTTGTTSDRLAGARVAVEDTPEEAAFRAEVREWFAANAKPRDFDDDTGNYFAMADNDPETHRKHVERCKKWQRTIYDGGWAGITLPKVQTYALPLQDLAQVAESSGLQWVNSDAAKIAEAQAAIAAEIKPAHVPRERPPVAVSDEGPLVLVETKRDLGTMPLPFEQPAA